MKGYYTDNGYMGYINGTYRLFADESDYRECLEDWVIFREIVWRNLSNSEKYTSLISLINRIFLYIKWLYWKKRKTAGASRSKWGVRMDTAKRMQLIRIIEKMEKNSEFSAKLGMQNKS